MSYLPVLKINDHATGRRTKDILGGPKGWGPKKKVANVEIYVIFEVFAFCGGRTKTDFKDRDPNSPYLCPLVCHHKKWQTEATMRPVAKPVNSCAESIPRLSAYSSIQTPVRQKRYLPEKKSH